MRYSVMCGKQLIVIRHPNLQLRSSPLPGTELEKYFKCHELGFTFHRYRFPSNELFLLYNALFADRI